MVVVRVCRIVADNCMKMKEFGPKDSHIQMKVYADRDYESVGIKIIRTSYW